jgi:non-ribosomal peptide synthetase component E (peptide arylation enzyme)
MGAGTTRSVGPESRETAATLRDGSAEVENAVCHHPAVAQCAVIAIPTEA